MYHAAMPDTPPIQFQQASKTYRDFWLRAKVRALRSFDLTVDAGEVVGLLGPNGSGKSTAIKLLTGLSLPTGGTVLLNGQNPRAAAARRCLGYLPEENANAPSLTALAAVEFHARLGGLRGAEVRNQSSAWLDRLGLAKAATRRAGTFSKGMARRLGLAQCLVSKPSVLVLDEPTSGLDPIATELVRDLIHELRRDGVTILLSSHLLAEIEDICDRVVVLNHGEVCASGKLTELLGLPGRFDARIAAEGQSPEQVTEALSQAGLLSDEVRPARRTLAELYREVVKDPEA